MYPILVNHGVIINMKTLLLALSAIAVSFGLLTACSEDSNADNSLVSVPSNTSAVKGKTTDYKESKSCSELGGNLLAKSSAEENKSIDFLMNEDGSATVVFEMNHNYIINTILYETRNDTLFVSSDYILRIPVVDSVTHDTTWIEDNSLEAMCFCRSEFELTLPSNFIGTQYVSFERENYTINYRKRE